MYAYVTYRYVDMYIRYLCISHYIDRDILIEIDMPSTTICEALYEGWCLVCKMYSLPWGN